MKRFLLLISTLAFATGAFAQQAPAPRQPTPEEVAFSQLPPDLQRQLAGLTPAQAMQTVAQAGQQAIALGTPQPTYEQFRGTLNAVMSGSAYTSASAGASTFPPLSPLVPPPPPPFLR